MFNRRYNSSELGRLARKRRWLKKLEIQPHKVKARLAVRNAVYRGKIKRLPCEVCRDENSQAHHFMGYEKEHWFDVKWLCRIHHVEEDKKQITN